MHSPITRQFTRFAQAGDYQPIQGAFCLNLVTSIIDYYRRQPEPYRLKTISLNQSHWNMLVEELKRLEQDIEIDATKGVSFEGCDVTVKRGSMFQTKEFTYEFYPVVTKGQA